MNRAPHSTSKSASGFVALVGAGPGDPELLTLKAVRHLAQADVVLLDALVDERVLVHCRKDVLVLDVGKRAGEESVAQDITNTVLIDEAKKGRYVVRVKGGDPFVFGRGGEEALALAAHHIEFEVVPGISSSVAAPMHFGIPVTHRGVANAFTVVTGTAYRDPNMLQERWSALAKAGGTLVFLMARRAVKEITARLIDGGLDASTPAALIVDGTRETAHIIEGTAANIAALVEQAAPTGAAMLVVGDVVSLRHQLQKSVPHSVNATTSLVVH